MESHVSGYTTLSRQHTDRPVVLGAACYQRRMVGSAGLGSRLFRPIWDRLIDYSLF